MNIISLSQRLLNIKAKPIALFLPIVLYLSACSSLDQGGFDLQSQSVPVFPDYFSEKPAIVSLEEIHQLTPQQEESFLSYFNAADNQNIDPHIRVANFLLNSANNFVYESKTYTASEAFRLNQGNCMSLAVATTALANLANIQIEYQLIDSTPVYQLSGSVANKGIHIRSLIYKPVTTEAVTTSSNNATSFSNYSEGGLIIDYFPSEDGRFIGNVSYEEYIAVYYRNIAAEALNNDDYSVAYWNTLESMKYDPLSSDALNMLAVAYKRIGVLDKAEEIYLYGINHAKDKLTLMKNYHILLTSQNRALEAETINRRLSTMNDPSPIHWFNVAKHSYDINDYSDAIRFYSRAIEIAPYLHEAHIGMALSYYQLGQVESAERALNRAINNVNDFSTRNLYESKLNALRRLL